MATFCQRFYRRRMGWRVIRAVALSERDISANPFADGR